MTSRIEQAQAHDLGLFVVRLTTTARLVTDCFPQLRRYG